MDLYEEARAFPGTLGDARRVELVSAIPPSLRSAVRHRVAHATAYRPVRGARLFGSAVPNLLERARSALAVSPPGTVLGYHTAAALQGFGVVASELIHLVVPRGAPFPQRSGIRVHHTSLRFRPAKALGLACTPAARTAIDLARSLLRAEALPVLDAVLFAGLASPDDLAAEVALTKGRPGSLRARDLAPLADARAQCRQESQLRLLLHDGGLPGFIPQLPVDTPDGRAFLDLGNPRTMVGAEYDGASHLTRDRLAADRRRHNALESLGWRMRYFTRDDLYRRPATILATLRQATPPPSPPPPTPPPKLM